MSQLPIEMPRLRSDQTIVPGSQVVRSDEIAHIGGTHVRGSSNGLDALQRSGTQQKPSILKVVPAGRTTSLEQPEEVDHREPKVEFIREGDIITAIDVTCSCGESIRLWCSYEG